MLEEFAVTFFLPVFNFLLASNLTACETSTWKTAPPQPCAWNKA